MGWDRFEHFISSVVGLNMQELSNEKQSCIAPGETGCAVRIQIFLLGWRLYAADVVLSFDF